MQSECQEWLLCMSRIVLLNVCRRLKRHALGWIKFIQGSCVSLPALQTRVLSILLQAIHCHLPSADGNSNDLGDFRIKPESHRDRLQRCLPDVCCQPISTVAPRNSITHIVEHRVRFFLPAVIRVSPSGYHHRYATCCPPCL